MPDGNSAPDTIPAPPPEHDAAIDAMDKFWSGFRSSIGGHELRALLTSASIRASELQCEDGWCDGGEPVSRCCRHELVAAVAETEVAIRLLLESKLKRLGIDGPVGQRFVRDALGHLLFEAEKGWFGW